MPHRTNPNLLFISPVVPATTGKGFAMRAGMVLEALADDYCVFLLVVPDVHGLDANARVNPDVSALCRGTAIYHVGDQVEPLFRRIVRRHLRPQDTDSRRGSQVPPPGSPSAPVEHNGFAERSGFGDPDTALRVAHCYPKPLRCRFASPEAIRGVARAFPEVSFDAIHVFRLYMAAFAEPYLKATPRDVSWFLDLDDYESQTHMRLASLYDEAGDVLAAERERSQSLKYFLMEREYLPLFDQVYVCSNQDRDEISRRRGWNHVVVVPNAVRLPQRQPVHTGSDPFVFLFVGSMDHYPNEDAVVFFCSQILPQLRAKAGIPFRISIVGAYPSSRVKALAREPEVTVAGEIPEVASHYRVADVVIVPLRAGGGTRIKILEAASYQKPVVSTAIGAEGLRMAQGEQILIADRPADFAEHCVQLMRDTSRGRALGQRAFEWVKANHTLEHVKRGLRQQDLVFPTSLTARRRPAAFSPAVQGGRAAAAV